MKETNKHHSNVDILICKICEAKTIAMKMHRFKTLQRLDTALDVAGLELADEMINNECNNT